MSMMIRRAGKQDIDTLISFLQELFSIETDFVADHDKQRAGLSLLLGDSDKKIIFVAVCGQDVAGMVTAQLVVSTAAGGYAVLLEDMFVKDKFRRRGVGQALLDAIKSWAEGKDAKRIQLLADQRNETVLAFYERFGFSESSMCGFYLAMEREANER